MLVDSAGVTLVASIGLRHLVSAAKAVAPRRSLGPAHPTPAVADVITTAGLADLLRIERDGAVQA